MSTPIAKPSSTRSKPSPTGGTGKPTAKTNQPPATAPNRGLLGQVEDAYSKPLSFEGMQGVTVGSPNYQGVTFSDPFNPGYQGVDFQRGTQGVDFSKPGMFGDVRRTDFGGIGDRFALGRPEDYGDERRSIEDATYQRAMRLMQPSYDRQEQRLQTDLANRGLAPTSEAYRDLRGQFDDQRQRDLGDLSLASVLAGAQEHQRLADLTSRNRLQLTAEGGQRYGEDLGIRQQHATEAAQRAQQQLGLRGIEATEAGNIMSAQLGLSGQQRQDAANRAGQQLGLRGAQRAEDSQRFGQQMTLRQQQIAEARLKRSQPANDLASLLAGTVTNPSMPSYTNYAIQSPDYMGLVGSNYASRANAHSAGSGGFLGLAGNALGGLFGG